VKIKIAFKELNLNWKKMFPSGVPVKVNWILFMLSKITAMSKPLILKI